MGIADHESIMYTFSHFLPYSSGNVFLSHANETKKICHESFRHLKYKYIQSLSKENMLKDFKSSSFPKAHARDALLGSM